MLVSALSRCVVPPSLAAQVSYYPSAIQLSPVCLPNSIAWLAGNHFPVTSPGKGKPLWGSTAVAAGTGISPWGLLSLDLSQILCRR